MNAITDRLQFLIGKMSQRQFAQKIGVSPSTLNEYLKGRIPPADFILRVCDSCGVSERWLLRGEDGVSANASGPIVKEDRQTYKKDGIQSRQSPHPFIDILVFVMGRIPGAEGIVREEANIALDRIRRAFPTEMAELESAAPESEVKKERIA